jgi:gamma-glutamylputrescine oxidase
MQNQAHVDSWYAATASPSLSFEPLQGEAVADVCIIGGGYTGLSSAIHLRKRGYSVALLEANRIGWGASGRNGGHVGTGQRADQHTLEKLVGLEHAKALWQLGLEAVDTVCGLIDEYRIDCELKEGNLHVASKPRDAAELEEEVEHLGSVYGYDGMRYVPPAELAEMTSGLSSTRQRISGRPGRPLPAIFPKNRSMSSLKTGKIPTSSSWVMMWVFMSPLTEGSDG